MDYFCKLCNRTFSTKAYLAKHNNRKTPCTAIHQCDKCEEIFISNAHLERHLKRKTPCDNIYIPDSDVKYSCRYCNKPLSSTSSVNRHQKTCKLKLTDISEISESERIKELELEVETLKKDKSSTGNTTVINNDNSTTNNDNSTTNNTININVQSMDDLRTFGNENFDYIDTEWLVRCIENNSNPKAAYKDLAEHVFFNVDHPENHNMRIIDKLGPAKVIVHYNKGKWDMIDISQALGMAGDNLRNVFQGIDGKWQGQDSAGEVLYNKYKSDHPIAQRATDVICNHTEDKFKVLDGIEDTMRDRKEVVSQTHSQLPKKDRPENVYKKMQYDKEEWNRYHGIYTQTYSGEPEDDTPLEEFESDDELFEQAHNDKERELFNNRIENPE
jgi:hypothetical protein